MVTDICYLAISTELSNFSPIPRENKLESSRYGITQHRQFNDGYSGRNSAHAVKGIVEPFCRQF
jgi:hypothetical protein